MAKELNYRSRAAFKLIEILDKFHIIKTVKNGEVILDLGAAPGGWSQVISERLKKASVRASIIGIDLLHVMPVSGVHFIQHDFLASDLMQKIQEILSQFDETSEAAQDREVEKSSDILENFSAALIVSDMLPNASGDKTADHLRFAALLNESLLFAIKYLKKGGFFVTKVIRCGKESAVIKKHSEHFDNFQFFKPHSSYSDSAEIFVVLKKK
ncbi:Ribosomal RNA large subunit methyltransferase E [Candidatus Fokinia solitaria]|uniref:Ribosomal RNA large subunit methyltransferase E n=2 Tax=Candidatus Fokinia solitaria TaxID=1802984 RepID=A0A2U8BT39_9RICK|nr:Ribosomal RNA large subunit methyltransferase E [Candidatus Fokinia solitaria]